MDGKYQKIMLVTDGLSTSKPAEETALNLALRDQSKILIVDTVKPPSLASRWLTTNAEDLFEMVCTDKQNRLEKVADRFRAVGLEAEVEVLCGKSSEEIAQEARVKDVDLVVRYFKGKFSRQSSFFGTTARNLMRVCHCPLLLVRDKAFKNPLVMACINAEHDFDENQSILSAAQCLARKPENTFALYCWKFYGAEIMKDYMNEDVFNQSIQEAEQAYRRVYDDFVNKHNMQEFKNQVRMENGDPIDLIPQISQHENVDVVVMSSASSNHPIKRLLGSTIEAVLDDLPCSLLVVKPVHFKSPLPTERSTVEIV